MEFRFPTAVAQANLWGKERLTKNLNLSDFEKDEIFKSLTTKLGNVIDSYPIWHPILNSSTRKLVGKDDSISKVSAFEGADHTVLFVRGFITCPYSELTANAIVKAVNDVPELTAHRLAYPLYSTDAYPVLVQVSHLELEDDGTINTKDAMKWYLKYLSDSVEHTQVADTWWSLKEFYLGTPCGSRSSILVNQVTGGNFKKLLDTLNSSGVYGPIRESSLDMLSKRKQHEIAINILHAAMKNYDHENGVFEFNSQNEVCHVVITDTWSDGYELSIRVRIGDADNAGLNVKGYYYPNTKTYEVSGNIIGKQSIAEKFLTL